MTTLPPPGAGPTRKTTTQIGARRIVVDDLTQAIPGGLGASLASTLQHIGLMKDREERIAAARHEAENQLLHRIGSAHRTGQITDAQLLASHGAYKALEITGRANRWNEHVDIPWNRMHHLARHLPNGPAGTWVGEWPMVERSTAPLSGVSVVYVLFDVANEPCYVGSTGDLRTRLKSHAKGGKKFVRWQAHRCRDREHAYELEVRLLREHRPYLNQRVGR